MIQVTIEEAQRRLPELLAIDAPLDELRESME